MSKPLTHIGIVQTVGRYSGGEKGTPRNTWLRRTKTRWYAGDGGYSAWWPIADCRGMKTWVESGNGRRSHVLVSLDLSTVRLLTVAELREPWELAVAKLHSNMVSCAEELARSQKLLAEAEAALADFDQKTRGERGGSGPPP